MTQKNTLIAPRKKQLFLQPVSNKGLGVFCLEDIEEGEVIETAPVIFFSKEDAAHIDKTSLYNYYFSTKFLPEKDEARAGCLAMGIMSLCNHDENPNAVIEKVVDEHAVIFRLKSLRKICSNNEILIHYGEIWFPIET